MTRIIFVTTKRSELYQRISFNVESIFFNYYVYQKEPGSYLVLGTYRANVTKFRYLKSEILNLESEKNAPNCFTKLRFLKYLKSLQKAIYRNNFQAT